MKKITNERMNETVYYKVLDNGLRVYLIPKTDFNKVFATFTTCYGSINTKFVCNKKEYDQPKGIAHYLEHKMFDMPDGVDVFNRLSKLGAQSNAFTSYDQTCYLFSATSNIYECIKILLDFVQTPYFTEESVEKERGIIEQEIKMYDDYPTVISDRGMMKMLFKNTPYKYDIAGEVSDIKKITKDDLYDAYNAFYNPSNMIFTVIGNFNKDEMLSFIEKNQSEKSFEKVDVKRIIDDEPMEVNNTFGEDKIGLAIPKINFGIKLKKEENVLKSEMKMLLYTALILGETSDYYNDLMNKKIINESFNCGYFVNKELRIINITGDSTDPVLLYNELKKVFNGNNKFDLDKFNLIKKAVLGEFITVFNSLEATSRLYTKYILLNESFFDIIDIINEITIDDLYEIDKSINLDNSSYHILY